MNNKIYKRKLPVKNMGDFRLLHTQLNNGGKTNGNNT